VRRFATLALSLSLLLGLSAAGALRAQDEKKDAPKAEEAKKDEPKKDEAKTSEEPKKDEAKKDEAKKSGEPKKDEAKKSEEPKKEEPAKPAEPPIPPAVEAKLEAARRAVAEAIVAAQDAGLVQTTIDPPPILDILILGRANDVAALKAITQANPEAGVSLEVFGAWFTGYGKMDGIEASKNVRIMQPSKGLKDFFDKRAEILKRHIDEVRKTTGSPAPKAEEKPKAEEPKKQEEKPKAEEPKKEEEKPK
jgi:pentapeptide MXKDX repeat protein